MKNRPHTQQRTGTTCQRANRRTGGKNADLEQMNRLFVNRELRMVELKVKIKELESGR
ncbi:MAG: hypothetical protein PHY09_14815 [Desulfuromonadaceae bacterium]|nr:hypothetical protein [Desulfuromonadaceae bacterium]MDD5106013.1 hypothetical protein [Desulfuromonadaceae bacterium]